MIVAGNFLTKLDNLCFPHRGAEVQTTLQI